MKETINSEGIVADKEGRFISSGRAFDDTPWDDSEYERVIQEFRDLRIKRELVSVASRYSGLTDMGAKIAFLRELGYTGVKVRGLKGKINFNDALDYQVVEHGEVVYRGLDSVNALYNRVIQDLGKFSESLPEKSKLVNRVLQTEIS